MFKALYSVFVCVCVIQSSASTGFKHANENQVEAPQRALFDQPDNTRQMLATAARCAACQNHNSYNRINECEKRYCNAA